MKIVKKVSNSDIVRKAIKQVDNRVLKVGWGKKQRYDDGTPVATVAVVQEFGSPAKNIPPRSFMRVAADNEGKNWARQFAGGLKKVLSGRMQASSVMEAIALLVEGDIKKAISSVTEPPLKEATIKARNRGKKVGNTKTASKPLVDTGYMLNSVTHEVTNK